MFRIESYITPILLNYVAKYVKNISSQDAQVSLWEGEVVFQNLDMRLDVLEAELNLPFEFLSGHIHELSIHVPWTKITSEPIRIVINTIEFVLKLKSAPTDGAGTASGSTSPQHGQNEVQRRKRSGARQDDQPPQQAAGSGLINKIINNISLQCHNIILKYIEEDIVVSMNVQLLSFGSADEQWKPAVVDVHPQRVVVRKLVQISDLTICLDKRNAAGQIDVCQEPIMYRCSLECRIFKKYNVNSMLTTSTTRVGVFTKSIDLNVSSLQFPMMMRLTELVLALKAGKMKTTSETEFYDEELEDAVAAPPTNSSYLAWAWSMIPSFTFEPIEEDEEVEAEPPGHTMDIGFYVEELNFTLKNSEFVNDNVVGATKRIRYTPIMRVSLGCMYFERVAADERNWSNMRAGVSSITIEPQGPFCSDEKSTNALVEAPSIHGRAFIDRSLFDENIIASDKIWGVADYAEYSKRVTDEYLLSRSPILAFDVVEYKNTPLADLNVTTTERTNELSVQYRLLSAGITFRFNQTFLQVKHIINDFINSYDYPAYYAEKQEGPLGSTNSLKLHPPLMEDYDRLMQHIPLCTYKFALRNIGVEIYPKVEHTTGCQKPQRRLSSALNQTLPYFLMHFDTLEGTLQTPLQQDKLVHTTCQLPDKPPELLAACYNNCQGTLQNFTLSLVSKSSKSTGQLIKIPKISFSYGDLLQTKLWQEEAGIPEKKMDIDCAALAVEFTKSELIVSERLFSCIMQYRPYTIWKLSKQQALSRSSNEMDGTLINVFKNWRVQWRRYQQYGIWNASLESLHSRVVPSNSAAVGVEQNLVLTTTPKIHDGRNKWLEVQVQLPCVDDNSHKTCFALWMHKYTFFVDSKLLDFMKNQEEPELPFEKDPSQETEVQTQIFLPPTPPATTSSTQINLNPLPSSMPSHHSVRRASRNAIPSRRISQPEETIHYSSERDDKADTEAVSSVIESPKEENFVERLKLIEKLVLNIEIAHGKVVVSENLSRDEKNEIISDYLMISLPEAIFKSSYADHIVRSNMRRQVKLDKKEKSSKNITWTLRFNDFSVQDFALNKHEYLVHDIGTTMTMTVLSNKDLEIHKQDMHRDTRFHHEESHIEFETEQINLSKSNSRSHHRMAAPLFHDDGTHREEAQPIIEEGSIHVVAINLHADTTPVHVHLSSLKVHAFQRHMNVLLKLLRLARPVAQLNNNAPVRVEPIKILTATEDDPAIKEFLDMDTNAEQSSPTEIKVQPNIIVSVFCQWTITKVIIELILDDLDQGKKIRLELEDLLSTVDKHEHYTKYTGKIGLFNLNYLEYSKEELKWQPDQCLRIKVLGGAVVPFVNVVVTEVGTNNFFKKIGAKPKGSTNKPLREFIINMEAIELIISLEKLTSFMDPVCALMRIGRSDSTITEPKQQQQPAVKALNLPLIHMDSKGIIMYLPLKTEIQSCSTLVLKIESLKVTPNLENPLQRNPIRTDVYSKAAQMGILGTPGSLVEDRQYELTVKNISAHTGNWNEVLTHLLEQNFHSTNPAFEWNNQDRKIVLRPTSIFDDFTFITIYAPCVVYKNILICGQAIELNCASDFIATLNTNQISYFSLLLVRLKDISSFIDNANYRTSSDSIDRLSQTSILLATNVSGSDISSSQSSAILTFFDQRSSTINSIKEDPERQVLSDSGFQSIPSALGCSRVSRHDKFATPPGSATVLVERFDHTQGNARHVPHTISLIAGYFNVKIFRVKSTTGEDGQLEFASLLSVTFSQPSFMVTQNIFDFLMQASLFNLHIAMGLEDKAVNFLSEEPFFPQVIFETHRGELSPTGIPPPLFVIKSHRTKNQLLEMDVTLGKPIKISLSERVVRRLYKHFLVINEALLTYPLFELRHHTAVVRGTKISLMRQQCFNADRLYIKCRKIIVKLNNKNHFNCKFMLAELKFTTKFLARPEKATVGVAVGSFSVSVGHEVFLHPLDMRVTADFITEPWHSLPLVIATAKFNVLQVDLEISSVMRLQDTLKGMHSVLARIQRDWQNFLRNRPSQVPDEKARNLLPMKYAQLKKSVSGVRKAGKANASAHREEFYRDDLRAGAFQFVELLTDTFLPMPYQIQIIKKNHGIICWRYPQPRKMCKIHVYPVPMGVSNPIHLKCRMEYFSEMHECFIHYCDFWLSETASKEITLPEREACANIWRVVILQSLVKVNGEYFENSDDEELTANAKIVDILENDRKNTEFILHPRVLVGCMRIDTSFQSKHVPKVQLLVSCNSIQANLQNQSDESGELPHLLKNYSLVQKPATRLTFLVFQLDRLSFHSSFHSSKVFTVDTSLACSIKCNDLGFLNMLYLLEETTMTSYVRVNHIDKILNCNIVIDKLKFNLGPSIINTLISSKRHWEDHFNETKLQSFIPKCIVVNRTFTYMFFGQTGTTERLDLPPQHCQFYSFFSDNHRQELTFFVTDYRTRIIEASETVHVPFKFEGSESLQYIRIGDKCVTIKLIKLSATQITVFVSGQIELISKVPHDFIVEFRTHNKNPDDETALEYIVKSEGCVSFYRALSGNSKVFMRLKFAITKDKRSSGDIPLKPKKALPWLVKVPRGNDFRSFWVRITREPILDVANDTYHPERLLITIWPIFEIHSTLSYSATATESKTKSKYELYGRGKRTVLSVPATHLTEHQMSFEYSFPLDSLSTENFTLSLKSIDWQKFFAYDEHKWSIESALEKLHEAPSLQWPFNDEEETRVQRSSKQSKHKCHVVYKINPLRDFACSLCLDVEPWGLFINASATDVSICDWLTKEQYEVHSNCVEMMSIIPTAFTINVLYEGEWRASWPVFFEKPATAALDNQRYILTPKGSLDVTIRTGEFVYKFVLRLRVEGGGRKIFRLNSKFVVANFSKSMLTALPFGMDQKDTAIRKDIQLLRDKSKQIALSCVQSLTNSIGHSLDCFYILNATSITSAPTSAWFISLECSKESEISIPIPLSSAFTRRCLSIQQAAESIPLVVANIEKDGIFYVHIFEDSSPAILIQNHTEVQFVIAQTNATENNQGELTAEYDGQHFVWFQQLEPFSRTYYTPPEMYASFPDVESTVCNLTLALCREDSGKKLKWSKPLRTDKSREKFLHIPHYGDVKVLICDKHRIIRLLISNVAQQREFSVKYLRSKLQAPKADDETPKEATISFKQAKSQIDLANYKLPKCTHYMQNCDTKTQLEFRFFIKEAVLSLHVDNKDCDYIKSEIFASHIDDFLLAYTDDIDNRQCQIIFSNLQIDNQLHSSGKYDFPVVLCAENLYARTESTPDAFHLERTLKDLLKSPPMMLFTLKFFDDELKISSMVCSVSPVRAYIEDAYLNDLLDAFVECEPSSIVYKLKGEEASVSLEAGQFLLPRDVTAHAVCIAEPLQLRSFKIEPLSIMLSVHTSVRLYIALDHSPLSFSSYSRKQILTVPLRFGQSVGMHYLSGAIFGAGWVVGSLEILGSPSGLARSFSTGLRDFVSMPVQGLFRGPWGFIVGVTQGSASLLRNVTAGTVNSVTKLAASVARNLDRMSLDAEHIERTEAIRRLRPQGFAEGFSQGVTGLGISILGAVGGLARHTLEARTPVQIVTGVGKGLVGAFTKPISGAAELVALTGQGVLESVGFNAMPQQRRSSTSRNMASEPASLRMRNLMPPGTSPSDQILFYHQVTLVLAEQEMRPGFVLLTHNLFAIIEANSDKLLGSFPISKVELSCDKDDNTLITVHILKKPENEATNYTNDRILNYLNSSQSRSPLDLTPDTPNSIDAQRMRTSVFLTFYISAHLGVHLLQYAKILNKIHTE